MKPIKVLEDALHRAAIIHQPHSIKAYLSTQYLVNRFDGFGTREWDKCLELNSLHELEVFKPSTLVVEYRDFNEVRIEGSLKRGIFPASYVAMRIWYERVGIETIFEFYEQQALKKNDYLLHSVSIFLAFKKIWPELTKEQIPDVLDRFAEFVTSTYYGKNQLTYPAKITATEFEGSEEQVIELALEQPGFWGHHLIALAWVLHNEDNITHKFKQTALKFIYEQTQWNFTDEGDYLNRKQFDEIQSKTDEVSFAMAIHKLVNETSRNVHQITLASALVMLWDRFINENIRGELYKMAVYFHNI